jgi:hypothetical protein
MDSHAWTASRTQSVLRQFGFAIWASVGLTVPSLAHSQAHVCPVTLPRSEASRQIESAAISAELRHENFVFWPGGAGFVAVSDGALGMKFGWDRKRHGRLSIKGRRLDGPAKPLRAFVPEMPSDIGFQSSNLIFPATGCWEVTAELGGDTLTFVVLVMKIGSGPAARIDR